jgi:hypothetical protein
MPPSSVMISPMIVVVLLVLVVVLFIVVFDVVVLVVPPLPPPGGMLPPGPPPRGPSAKAAGEANKASIPERTSNRKEFFIGRGILYAPSMRMYEINANLARLCNKILRNR